MLEARVDIAINKTGGKPCPHGAYISYRERQTMNKTNASFYRQVSPAVPQ